jgi:peptide/nickel transport system permease protein
MDVSAPITNTNKTATNSEFQRRLQKHQLASFTEYRVLSFSIGATAIFALIFALNIYDLGEKTVSGFFLKTALIYTVSLIFQIALRLKIVSEILATQNLSRSTRICGVLLLPFVLAGNVFSFVAGCTMFLKEITIEYQICIYMMLTNVSIIIVSVLNLFKDSVSNTFWLGLFLLFVMLVVSLGITLLVSKHITQKTIYKRMIWLCIPLVIISFSGNVFAFALALVIYKRCTQENLEISIKWVDIMRRLFKNQMAVTGLFVVVFLIALSICSTLTFDEAMAIDNDYSALLVEPCIKYPFGTDDFGRCVFSRIVYGARISLIIGLAAISYPMLLGGILGALAGYYGGRLDNVIMRTLDIIYAIPGILLSMVIIASFGANMVTLVFALGVHSIASYARVTRASVLTMANAEFVEAAKACGANDRVVIFKHILLNSMAPIIVNATIGIGGVVLSTSALSYLGIGIPSHIPEWGNVLRAGSAYLETKPYLAIFPGLAIMTIVLAYNFLGDGLRDALDPKLK